MILQQTAWNAQDTWEAASRGSKEQNVREQDFYTPTWTVPEGMCKAQYPQEEAHQAPAFQLSTATSGANTHEG